MVGRTRFWLYRNIVAIFTMLAFRVAEGRAARGARSTARCSSVPYAEIHPRNARQGLVCGHELPAGRPCREAAQADPPAEQAARARQTHRAGINTAGADRRGRAFCTPCTRGGSARPGRPRRRLPRPLADTDDLVAELAVRGPFASGLRKVEGDRYEFGSEWIGGYPVAPGLARPGGVATLVVRDGRLVTEHVGRRTRRHLRRPRPH